MKMSPLFSLPLSILSLCTPLTAQVEAATHVRRGCASLAAPDSLRAAPVEPMNFLPDGRGVVNIEMESVGPRGSWVLEDEIEGHRGRGYLRWAGHNLFDKPAVDQLTFRFDLEKSTTYLIRLRNRHDHPDPTSENDCWFRIDGGPWLKLVDSWGSEGISRWSFNAYLETTGAFPEYELEAGPHVVDISPRSANFKLDSLHVLPRSVWYASETDPESELERQRPRIGAPFTFLVDDPTDAWDFTPFGTLVFPVLAPPGANASCGASLGAVGELLLDPAAGLIGLGTRTWSGPGDPSVFTSTIPYEPSFLGVTFTLQALLSEPGRMRLTDALDLLVGDQ